MLTVFSWPGLIGGEVRPSEHELVPRAHVVRVVTDRVGTVGRPTRGHQGPEVRRVVVGSGRVVVVRQAEVVAVLVREHTGGTVLGLGRVVADPQLRAGHAVATQQTVLRALRADTALSGVPAVAPDRVATLRTAAGLFALAGVHQLEVVDVTVGLIEVAVAVTVVAVLGVDLARRPVDALVDAARGLQARPDHAVDRTVQVVRPVAAGAVGSELGLGGIDVHPLRDLPLDRVAAGAHLEVVVVHRVVPVGATTGREQHVVEVLPGELRHPVGAVVLRAIGLRDLSADRIVELREHRHDVIGVLQRVVDELPVRQSQAAVLVRPGEPTSHEVGCGLLVPHPFPDEIRKRFDVPDRALRSLDPPVGRGLRGGG